MRNAVQVSCFFSFSLLLLAGNAVARPAWMRTPQQRIKSEDSLQLKLVSHFVHQVAVGDLICTGTIVSTNDGRSAEFVVDEVLWGQAASSNITIRRVGKWQEWENPETSFFFNRLGRHLLLAYTNNWWSKYDKRKSSWDNESILNLYDYITPTSRPPDHAVFDDYRVLDIRNGMISFDDYIVTGGTNYWEGMRTFITNFNDIARIQHDELKAYEWFYNLNSNTNMLKILPPKIKRGLWGYKWLRYDIEHLPPPDQIPR